MCANLNALLSNRAHSHSSATRHVFASPNRLLRLQMLTTAAAELNAQPLPAAEDRPGLALPARKTLVVSNVQYRAEEAEHHELAIGADDVMDMDPAVPDL